MLSKEVRAISNPFRFDCARKIMIPPGSFFIARTWKKRLPRRLFYTQSDGMRREHQVYKVMSYGCKNIRGVQQRRILFSYFPMYF